MEKQSQKLAQATMDQLKAEIIASQWGNVKAFANELGIDYYTYRRYIVGENDMKMQTLFRSIAVLGLEPTEFFAQAEARAKRSKRR